MIERAQRSAAKIFAVTWLLGMALLQMVFPRYYAPYLVWENGEETARHFVHHEEAIRIFLAGAFVHRVGMIVLAGGPPFESPQNEGAPSFPQPYRGKGGRPRTSTARFGFLL